MQRLRKLKPANQEALDWLFDNVHKIACVNDDEDWLEYSYLCAVQHYLVEQRSLRTFLSYARDTLWTENSDVKYEIDRASLKAFYARLVF